MSRISVKQNGIFVGWFDADKAEIFKERTFWDGNNWISNATGSQFKHETLYLTAGGKFILNRFSDYAGSSDTYEMVSTEEAAEWFAKQDFPEDEIPEVLREEADSMEIV